MLQVNTRKGTLKNTFLSSQQLTWTEVPEGRIPDSSQSGPTETEEARQQGHSRAEWHGKDGILPRSWQRPSLSSCLYVVLSLYFFLPAYRHVTIWFSWHASTASVYHVLSPLTNSYCVLWDVPSGRALRTKRINEYAPAKINTTHTWSRAALSWICWSRGATTTRAGHQGTEAGETTESQSTWNI